MLVAAKVYAAEPFATEAACVRQLRLPMSMETSGRYRLHFSPSMSACFCGIIIRPVWVLTGFGAVVLCSGQLCQHDLFDSA